MRKIYIFLILASIFLSDSCNYIKNVLPLFKSRSALKPVLRYEDSAVSISNYLEISANRLWAVENPQNSKVVFELKKGDRCLILKKGPEQTVNGMKDFWYLIKFGEKEGWVFGAFTSVSLNKDLSEQEQIKNFILYFLHQHKNLNYENLYSYFIDDYVFLITKPGAIPAIKKVYFKDALKTLPTIKIEPNIYFEKIPSFNFDTYQWDKHGIFIQKISNDSTLLDIITIDEFLDTREKEQLQKKADLLTYKVLVTQGEGVILYIILLNYSYKILAINLQTFEA